VVLINRATPRSELIPWLKLARAELTSAVDDRHQNEPAAPQDVRRPGPRISSMVETEIAMRSTI